MPSLIIEITVRDPELLGNGLSKRMELRGQSQVPASMLKPVSAAITAELIDDLKSARGQSTRSSGQLELIPLESDPLRPLNIDDDNFTLGESLTDAINAFLREDADRTELEKTAHQQIGDAIAIMRESIPANAAAEMAMMHALDHLASMPPSEAIDLLTKLPDLESISNAALQGTAAEKAEATEARAAAAEAFLEHHLGIVIDYGTSDAEEAAEDATDSEGDTEDSPADDPAYSDMDDASAKARMTDDAEALDGTVDSSTGEILSPGDVDALRKRFNKRSRRRDTDPADDAPAAE